MICAGLRRVISSLFSEKKLRKKLHGKTRRNPAQMEKPELKEKDDTGKATLEPRLREE